ncbi:MAG: fimbrillin family protein, partial [Alistipes sp.]|nr:fimbrillin family protein [Alistipes sp.]
CSKSDVESRPVVPVVGDVEIVSGSKVSVITRTPFEGTLDDKANNKLTAYVYATKLDVANSNAYVSYDAANLAAEGYMTFVSSNTQDGATSKYPVAAVGFQKEDTTPGTYVADPQYYPSNDNPLYMVGLVPAVKADWTMDADSKVATHAIDGKTDIMAAAVTKMKDATNTDVAIQKSKASATVYPTFNFKHKLTLVNVKVYTPTQKEQAAWGKITKIELVAVNKGTALSTDGVNDQCDVTLETGVAAWSATATGKTTPFYAYNTTDKYTDKLISTDADKTADADANFGAVEIATATTATGTATVADAQYVAYSMIAPFTVKSNGTKIENLKLKVYTEKNTDGVDAIIKGLYETSDVDPDSGTIYVGSTEGKKFDVTLKFAGKEIKASAAVTDWEEKFAGEVEII